MPTGPSPKDFSIQDVLAWARTKPADERYDYFQPDYCAVAKFGRETGRPHLIGIPGLMSSRLVPVWLADVIMETEGRGWSYGALVARLEALVPETTPSEWTRLDAYLSDIESVAADHERVE
jgi:hypothetical protein